MSVAKSNFPSSVAFDALNAALQESSATKAQAIKQGNAVFLFNVTNQAGDSETWTLDLKNTGQVQAGTQQNADVTLSLSDENLGKLMSGKANAQKLFMGGNLKIKGDMLKASRLTPILGKIQTPSKL